MVELSGLVVQVGVELAVIGHYGVEVIVDRLEKENVDLTENGCE